MFDYDDDEDEPASTPQLLAILFPHFYFSIGCETKFFIHAASGRASL
jgi:hypothetical protein